MLKNDTAVIRAIAASAKPVSVDYIIGHTGLNNNDARNALKRQMAAGVVGRDDTERPFKHFLIAKETARRPTTVERPVPALAILPPPNEKMSTLANLTYREAAELAEHYLERATTWERIARNLSETSKIAA